MTTEFSKKQNKSETVYTLESATGGGTSSGSIASVSSPMGGVRKRGDNLIAQEADKKQVVPTSKPRNFVAKNATTGGAGAHVDKKRAQKQGQEKHKKPFAESAFEYTTEKQIETRIRQIMYDRKLSGTDSNAGELNRLKARLKDLRSQQGVAEGMAQLSMQQLATISDQALDNAYHYGRSTPGNTFGWQANLKSAEFAKRMIDAGETDIEKISDAIHQGWNVTARAFVQNPEQFDDTEKLRAAGKLDAKLQQREKLMNVGYGQLPDDEQEKDRVVARALLQAIQGDQDVAEGSNSSPFNQEQNLRSKSDKELADLIQFWNRALEKNPEHKIAREQLGLIKMIRAERIGKKLAEKTASKDVTEMDNRTPSGDRRERRANSPKAMTQREKELQNNLKKVSPELRKKLQLPEPKEGVSEDHEIQMASSELQSIAKNAVNLLDLVRRYSEREGLQAWQQSKITKSADYLNSVLQSISGEQHDTGMAENFKDGKNPGRKGLAKRSGVNTKASVSSLRDTARHSSGEKQRMAHWLANMKSGRAKNEGVAEGDKSAYVAARYIDEFADGDHWYVKGTQEIIQRFVQLANNLEDESLTGTEYAPGGVMSKMHTAISGDDDLPIPQWKIVPAQNLEELRPINNNVLIKLSKPDLSDGVGEFMSDFLWGLEEKGLAVVHDDMGNVSDQSMAEGSTQKYEMMLRNGQVKKFVAKDDADARRIAAGHGAKSVIRMKGNVPGDKIGEQGVAEVKAVKQRLDPKCWKGKHKEGTKVKGGIRVNNCVPNESHDAYSQRLQATLENTLAEKIPANAPVDVWVQDFQKADPQKYHQFKNKTPEKKAQMAVAASYAAKNPSKKK